MKDETSETSETVQLMLDQLKSKEEHITLLNERIQEGADKLEKEMQKSKGLRQSLTAAESNERDTASK